MGCAVLLTDCDPMGKMQLGKNLNFIIITYDFFVVQKEKAMGY